MRLVARADVEEGIVFRQPRAYPVYNLGFRKNIDTIRDYLSTFSNLQTIGRNGMHRYNNMDHSMLTGILAARNIARKKYDLWRIDEWNVSAEGNDIGDGFAAGRHGRRPLRNYSKWTSWPAGRPPVPWRVFPFSSRPLWLVIKGGVVIGPNLQLLSQYYYGYTVTVPGPFWGCATVLRPVSRQAGYLPWCATSPWRYSS
jgi:hypothetical protein